MQSFILPVQNFGGSLAIPGGQGFLAGICVGADSEQREMFVLDPSALTFSFTIN